MPKVPQVLIQNVLTALDIPLTLYELGQRTGYGPGRLLAIINSARAQGYEIRAVEDGITRNVPARARPEEGAFSTMFEVVS